MQSPLQAIITDLVVKVEEEGSEVPAEEVASEEQDSVPGVDSTIPYLVEPTKVQTETLMVMSLIFVIPTNFQI